VREPPPHVRAHEVRDLVAHHWSDEVDGADHLPVGFGAHHWAAYAAEVTAGRRQQLVAGVRPHGANRP